MTAAEPVFDRVAGTNLFWLAGASRTIGFQASAATPGDHPTLAQTWADAGGLYLFLAAAPADDAAFEAALLPFLQSAGWPGGPRFLWLANPGAPVSQWAGEFLRLDSAGGASTVARRADFRFCNYTLTVLAGSAVTLGTAAQDWGFVLAAAAPLPVATFFAPGGTYPAADGMLRLPLAGATPGCWLSDLLLADGGSAATDFDRLRVGIRYFRPETPGAERGRGQVRTLELPTLRQPPAGVLRLGAVLDPLRPLAPQRTHFSLCASGAAPPAMNSTFATARGHGVTLTPLPAAGAVPDAGFVFGVHPLAPGGGTHVPVEYYLTLQGAFAAQWQVQRANTAVDDIEQLLCGASGLEYLGFPVGAGAQLQFIPGQPAFTTLRQDADPTAAPLLPLGTTAWMYASTDPGQQVKYYAQPENAPFYEAPRAAAAAAPALGSTFLDFLEMPALALSPPDGTKAFPVAPYLGLDAGAIADALELEAAAIAPARRRALLDANPHACVVPPGTLEGTNEAVTAHVGVTPQGLAVGVGTDKMEWTWVGIANEGAGIAAEPSLKFTAASGSFRQALETNRLFLVMANAKVFADNGSVAYQLTPEGFAEIAAEAAVPPAILTAVQAAFAQSQYKVYERESEFDAVVLGVAGAQPYLDVFRRKAGLLTPFIAGWRFQLSPRNWWNPGRTARRHAMLVFKFATGRSLIDYVADTSTWTWPQVAAFEGGNLADAQAELQSIFQDALAREAAAVTSGTPSPYAPFARMLRDENWTGILAFSVDVPLDTLPEPLQALAAGIDTRKFFAHHVGFNLTPFGADPGHLLFGPTSMFGLIDYQDPEDQYFESSVYYAFKVLQLTVGFRNSVVTDFASRVELLVNRMFGAVTNLAPSEHGNNVLLDGVYQREQAPDGTERGTYVFAAATPGVLHLAAGALRRVTLRSAQMVTTKAAVPGDPSSPVVAMFVLDGDMEFFQPAPFDPFAYGHEDDAGVPGALRFGNLSISMRFTMADRARKDFAFLTSTLSFDLANSLARPGSLVTSFPVTLAGMLATADPAPPPNQADAPPGTTQPPSQLGFVSVTSPLQQGALIDPWYGLVYEIDLGTLGALAASTGLKLSLLVAWCASGQDGAPDVYVGVKLPGLKDALGVELPLQGVITLGFRGIEWLVVDGAAAGTREYMLRFRNFALRFLGIAFPPGYNDIYLMGNPSQAEATKLAWYAAYASDEDPKRKGATPPAARRALAARRHAPARGDEGPGGGTP